MIQVNTHEAKTNLSALLNKVEKEHEKITICRNGKPIAVLSHISEARNPLEQHQELQGVQFLEDPTLPLSEDEWPEDMK